MFKTVTENCEHLFALGGRNSNPISQFNTKDVTKIYVMFGPKVFALSLQAHSCLNH